MAADTLRRVGRGLIMVGLADIGFMVYCIANELSYRSSLNIFAVVAGIYLLRQNMKAASVVSFFAAFMFSGMTVGSILFSLLVPSDLVLIHFRIAPVSSSLGILVAVAFLGFAFWVYRNLTSPVVMEARRRAGVNAKKPVAGFVVGIALAVGLSILLALTLTGATAQKAISMARVKTGPGYKYQVTSLHWSDASGSATVAAYNNSEIKEVTVEWQSCPLTARPTRSL